jgi:hypothetical protein
MKLDEGNNGWMTGWMHEWMDEWMDDGWVEWMNNVNMATASHEPYHRFCVSKLLAVWQQELASCSVVGWLQLEQLSVEGLLTLGLHWEALAWVQ